MVRVNDHNNGEMDLLELLELPVRRALGTAGHPSASSIVAGVGVQLSEANNFSESSAPN